MLENLNRIKRHDEDREELVMARFCQFVTQISLKSCLYISWLVTDLGEPMFTVCAVRCWPGHPEHCLKGTN